MTIIPWKVHRLLALMTNGRDLASVTRFVFRRDLSLSLTARLRYIAQIYWVSLNVTCPHTQQEIIAVATAVLQTPQEVEGVVVEAGCYKGGSTAKFSLAARLANRRLIVFDSFEGLPANEESNQRSIYGEVPTFKEGIYQGTLDEVTNNVRRFGDVNCCTFVKGWFDDTMPEFAERIVVAYLDVDLASSTKSCLKALFPRLQLGGSMFSQDCHLPLVIKVFDDDSFWEREVGCDKPLMDGLHKQKLVQIVKRQSRTGASRSLR